MTSRILIFSPSAFQAYGHGFDYVSGLTEAATGDLELHVLGFEGPRVEAMSNWATAHSRKQQTGANAKGTGTFRQVAWGFRRMAQFRGLVQEALDLCEELKTAGVFFESFEYYTLARRIAEFRCPMRCLFHDTSFNTRQTSMPAAIYKKAMRASAAQIVSRCERVFVHGAAMKQNLATSLGLNARLSAQVTAIPYGAIRPDESHQVGRGEARRALGIEDGRPVLLAFGTLRRDKDFSLLLQAIALAGNWSLLIAGPEGDRTFEEVEGMARALGISSRVSCRRGFVGRDEQPKYFGAADAVAGIYSPSIRHESGTCQIARTFLKPVVVSGPPDLEDYVQQAGVGWVARNRTAEGVAEVLSQIESTSEAQRRAMRQRIENSAEERSWDRVAAELLRGWS